MKLKLIYKLIKIIELNSHFYYLIILKYQH